MYMNFLTENKYNKQNMVMLKQFDSDIMSRLIIFKIIFVILDPIGY